MTVRLGDNGGEVSTVQRHLIREDEKSLTSHGADGFFGEETKLAVEDFQAKHSDLAVDGVAGPATQARLISVNQWSGGEQGRGVKDLQLALNGFTIEVEPDGIYGPLTADAVRTFQSHNGIQVDGAAGPVTFDTLDKALNVTQVQRGSQGTIFSSVVRAVQAVLIENGINVSIDGNYGPATEAGVRTLQSQHHLVVDGIAGEITLSLVYTQSFFMTLTGEDEEAFYEAFEYLYVFHQFVSYDSNGMPVFDRQAAIDEGISASVIEEYEEIILLMIEYLDGVDPASVTIQNRNCVGDQGYDRGEGRIYLDSCDTATVLSYIELGETTANVSGLAGLVSGIVFKNPYSATAGIATYGFYRIGRWQFNHASLDGCGTQVHILDLPATNRSPRMLVPYWVTSQC